MHRIIVTMIMIFILGCAAPDLTAQRRNSAKDEKNAATLADEGMFLKVTVSDSEVFVGEPIICTVMLYNPGVEITGVRFSGVGDYGKCDMRVNIDPGNAYYLGREEVDGRIYDVAMVSQIVLTPTSKGKMTIQPPGIEVEIAEYRNIDPFMPFFSRRDVRRASEKTPSVKLKAINLPKSGKPADFSGAVGNFKISAAVASRVIKKDHEFQCVFRITGEGSLENVKFPAENAQIPESLKIVSVSPSDRIFVHNGKVVSNGEYVVTFIPSKSGRVTLPAIEFSFFNPDTMQYESVSTEPLTIDIESLSSSNSQPMYI